MPNLPFHSFAFTLVENRRPRASFRMACIEDGLYELRVQRGSAANPVSQFTRKVPIEAAERLRDALQAIGVFGWEESYGDTAAPGTRRWSMATVFQEGVFSVESKGGSDVPPGFDDLLEELYRLDFPRPVTRAASSVRAVSASLSAGDMGAFASMGRGGVDFTQLAKLFGNEGLPGLDGASMSPQEIERRMKEEFHHLPPAERNRLLDALAATGLASRAWWERFFGL